MPMKMTARSTSIAAATHGCPPRTAPLRIVNSLRNSPNGGDPVTAKSPMTSNPPVTERDRRMPWILGAYDVPVARTTLPTARKSSPFARPLLIRCSTVP